MPLDNYFTKPDFSRQIKQYSGTTAILSGQTNILEKFSIKSIEVDTNGALDGNALLFDSVNNKFLPGVIGAFGLGIILGLQLTYNSGLTYDISSGKYRIGGTIYDYSGGSVNILSGQSGGSRLDIVYITTAITAFVKTGITATNPSVPSLSGGELEIGIILVPVNFTGGTGSTIIQTTADTTFEFYSLGTGIQRSPNTTNAQAPGNFSFAPARNSIAFGQDSVALGYYSRASGASQTVVGQYNVGNTTDYFIVGYGADDSNRANAFNVTNSGDTYANRKLFVTNVEIETTGATNGKVLKFDGSKFTPQLETITGLTLFTGGTNFISSITSNSLLVKALTGGTGITITESNGLITLGLNFSGTSLGNGVKVLFSSDTASLSFATLSSQTPSTLSIISSSTGVILFSATTSSGGISGTYVSGLTSAGTGNILLLSSITNNNLIHKSISAGTGMNITESNGTLLFVSTATGGTSSTGTTSGTSLGNGVKVLFSSDTTTLSFATLSSLTPSTLSIISSSTGVILFSAVTGSGGISGTYVSGITSAGTGNILLLSSITNNNLIHKSISAGTGMQITESDGTLLFVSTATGGTSTGNFLPLSGGTLTGGLSGTSITATTFYGDASNLTGVLSKTNLLTTLTINLTTKIVPLDTFYLYDKIILSAITITETVTAITSDISISSYTPSIKFFANTGVTVTFRNSTVLKTEGGLDAVIVGDNYDSITFTYNNNIQKYFQTNINNYI